MINLFPFKFLKYHQLIHLIILFLGFEFWATTTDTQLLLSIIITFTQLLLDTSGGMKWEQFRVPEMELGFTCKASALPAVLSQKNQLIYLLTMHL